MSNPISRFDPTDAYADFLTANNDLLQTKVDPRGSELDEIDSNTRSVAAWANLVDDFMLAIAQGLVAAVCFDNRAAPFVTGSATLGGGTVDFQFTLGRAAPTVHYLRVESLAPSVGGRVQFFTDAARTKLCYESLIQTGSPPVDDDTYSDGTPWACIAEDGTDLGAAGIIYGRIRNDGASNSTYEVMMRVWG